MTSIHPALPARLCVRNVEPSAVRSEEIIVFEQEDEVEYLGEDELRDRDIEPALVRVLCPWATEFTGHDGQRCWAVADLAPLLEGSQV